MVEAKPSRDNLAILGADSFSRRRMTGGGSHEFEKTQTPRFRQHMSIRHSAQDICPSSPFRWRPNTPHDLPIPTPTENRITPIPLTHAFLWMPALEALFPRERRQRQDRGRIPRQRMPLPEPGPQLGGINPRMAAGCPKNDGSVRWIFGFSCRWLSMRDSDWRSARTSLFHRCAAELGAASITHFV